MIRKLGEQHSGWLKFGEQKGRGKKRRIKIELFNKIINSFDLFYFGKENDKISVTCEINLNISFS